MPAVASKQGPTDHTGKADLSGAMQCGLLVRPWDTKMSGLLPRSSVVVTWKAGCGESRTTGLEWGKDREVLPITTGEVAILPRYPTIRLRKKDGCLAGSVAAVGLRSSQRVGRSPGL